MVRVFTPQQSANATHQGLFPYPTPTFSQTLEPVFLTWVYLLNLRNLQIQEELKCVLHFIPSFGFLGCRTALHFQPPSPATRPGPLLEPVPEEFIPHQLPLPLSAPPVPLGSGPRWGINTPSDEWPRKQ